MPELTEILQGCQNPGGWYWYNVLLLCYGRYKTHSTWMDWFKFVSLQKWLSFFVHMFVWNHDCHVIKRQIISNSSYLIPCINNAFDSKMEWIWIEWMLLFHFHFICMRFQVIHSYQTLSLFALSLIMIHSHSITDILNPHHHRYQPSTVTLLISIHLLIHSLSTIPSIIHPFTD